MEMILQSVYPSCVRQATNGAVNFRSSYRHTCIGYCSLLCAIDGHPFLFPS